MHSNPVYDHFYSDFNYGYASNAQPNTYRDPSTHSHDTISPYAGESVGAYNSYGQYPPDFHTSAGQSSTTGWSQYPQGTHGDPSYRASHYPVVDQAQYVPDHSYSLRRSSTASSNALHAHTWPESGYLASSRTNAHFDQDVSQNAEQTLHSLEHPVHNIPQTWQIPEPYSGYVASPSHASTSQAPFDLASVARSTPSPRPVGATSFTGMNRKHECKICHKTFTRPTSLLTHMNSHTGDQPFKCEFPGCPKAFSVRSNARRHLLTHGVSPRSASHSRETSTSETAF